MLRRCGGRRIRKRFVTLITILGSFLIISFLIHSNSHSPSSINRIYSNSRLYCVLVQTRLTQERFIHLTNSTWAKHCHTIGVVRYKQLRRPDDDANIPQSPYHVNLWTRILDSIRQSIGSDAYISTNDILIVVPASTFVFREKLPSLIRTSNNNSQSPLIIIHRYQDTNAYILNGQALNLVYSSELIDSCLQQTYPSARETHLWKCVKDRLDQQQTDTICKQKSCFIQYHRTQLTLDDIKNGTCLENKRHICQSIAFIYPTTFNDFVTLEFFKYRLKSKSLHDL